MVFPSRSRLQDLLRPYVWGTFGACGIVYTVLCLEGNVHYALGRDSSEYPVAMGRLRRAAEIFPLNHGFRLGPAYYFMFTGMGDREDIVKALKNDPNAPDLRRHARQP